MEHPNGNDINSGDVRETGAVGAVDGAQRGSNAQVALPIPRHLSPNRTGVMTEEPVAIRDWAEAAGDIIRNIGSNSAVTENGQAPGRAITAGDTEEDETDPDRAIPKYNFAPRPRLTGGPESPGTSTTGTISGSDCHYGQKSTLVTGITPLLPAMGNLTSDPDTANESPGRSAASTTSTQVDDIPLEDGPTTYIMRKKDVTDDYIRRQVWRTGSAIKVAELKGQGMDCLLYTSPSPRDRQKSRMPSSA